MITKMQDEESLERICEKLNLTPAEARFMDEQNPCHYAGRLMDLGFKPRDAKEIAQFYNEMIFSPVMEIYKRMKEQGEYNGTRK